MVFNEPDIALTEADIRQAESTLGFVLPPALRRLYLEANGGSPEPYVFIDEEMEFETVVSEFLPLKSGRGVGTAVQSYQRLVAEKKLCPPKYFPMAVDGGGDYFFVDCTDDKGQVYYLSGDLVLDDPENALFDLDRTVTEFWASLVPEEET